MSLGMEYMSIEDVDSLAGMQLKSLEVAKVALTPFDVANKVYVDTRFAQAISTATQSVTDLVAGAPSQLDTLKEISNALLDNSNLGAVLTTHIGLVQASVTTEATVRAAAVQTVMDAAAAQVVVHASQRQSDRAESKTYTDDEALYRAQADARVEASVLASLASRDVLAMLAEQKVDAEIANRVADSIRLESAINTEHNQRTSNDFGILTRVDDEKQQSEARDAVLSTQIADGLATESTARQAQHTFLMNSIEAEAEIRQNGIGLLVQGKFDSSPYYSGGSEAHFKISDDAYLYIGSKWRVAANNTGARRLEFQYSQDGSEAGFKTAVPFIRA